jgi:hypothetical protein
MTYIQLKRALSIGIISIGGSSCILAQEAPRFAFDVGGGFTQTIGNTSTQLDETGWNITAGAGFNFSSYVGTMIDIGYNRFGINAMTLAEVGFPGGDVGIFSATVNPIVHLTPGHHADIYLIGGGGLFHLNQEFTQPSVSPLVGFNPFFGFYNALVPTTQILASYSVNKPGIDAGAGFQVGTRWHGKVFAEARYNRVFTGNDRHVDYVPVTFGFRW